MFHSIEPTDPQHAEANGCSSAEETFARRQNTNYKKKRKSIQKHFTG